jgi:hypothetical protein
MESSQTSPGGVQGPGDDQPDAAAAPPREEEQSAPEPQPEQPADDAPEADEPEQDDAAEASDDAPDHVDASVEGATAPAGGTKVDPETGVARQHGEITPGLGVAPDAFPDAGTATAQQGVSEPEQVETDRPDIGTPTEGEGE